MADTTLSPLSDSWPPQRFSAKKQQTLLVLVLQLGTRKRASRNELGKIKSYWCRKRSGQYGWRAQVGISPERMWMRLRIAGFQWVAWPQVKDELPRGCCDSSQVVGGKSRERQRSLVR